MLRQWLKRGESFQLNPSLSRLWSDLAEDVPTATQWHARSVFIRWDKTEPRHTLMSCHVHTHTHSQDTYIFTYPFLFTTPGPRKNIMVFNQLQLPLWGSTFITYDRSGEGTIFQRRAEIEMKEIVRLGARQRLQFSNCRASPSGFP